jgi:hypothetical protein
MYCQIHLCKRKADFNLYDRKPVCNFHGQIIIKLKRENPQAFIHWKDPRYGRNPRGKRSQGKLFFE